MVAVHYKLYFVTENKSSIYPQYANYNSTIFKTIGEGDTTKVVTALQARKIAQEELNTSLAEQAVVLETDRVALEQLESQVAQGIPYEQAFAQSMNTASVSAKEHAIATKGAAGSTEVFVVKQKAAQTELKATSAAAKGAGIAMKALSVIGNMLIFTAITTGISLLTKAIDDYIHASENAIALTDELKSKHQEIQSEYESHRQTVGELASSYERLSKGVDTLTNKNIDLSDEDYEEYLRITNELADTFPSLYKALDDNGNAILTLGQNGRTASQDLQELLKAEEDLNNYKISQDIEGLFGGVKVQIDEAQKSLNDYKASSDEMEKSFQALKDLSEGNVGLFSNDNLSLSVDTSTQGGVEYFNALTKALQNFNAELDADRHVELDGIFDPANVTRQTGDTAYEFYLNLWKLTDEEKQQLQNEIKSQATDILPLVQDEISSAFTEQSQKQQEADLAWRDFLPSLVATMKSQGSFKDLADDAFGEDIQNFAIDIVSNLDRSVAEEMDKTDPYGWVRNNIILPLTKLDDADRQIVSETYKKLLELNPNDLSEVNQSAIDALIKTLATLLGQTEADIRLNLGFEIDENLKTKYNSAITKAISGLGIDKKEAEGLFTELGIDTTTEIDKWNEVTAGINNATEAKERYLSEGTAANETDILSFSDAWNSKDFEDVRKELLSLAEAGQLTPETLQSTEEYKTLLEQTGLSAEEAAKKINSMTDASTQLQSMSAQISKMSDMLADKKNGTVASASDLAGFDATVKGLESWEEFERVMGSTTSTMEECQAAANALATEWVNNGNFLANLTEENKDYYIQQLKTMGVENAEIVVLKNLEKVEAQDFIAKKDLNVAAQDAYEGLIKEGEGAGISKLALIDLIAQEQIFSNSSLSVSGKISELSALASAYLGTAAAAKFAASTSVSGMGSDSRYYTDSYVQDQWKNALPDYKVDFDIAPTGSGNYKPSGGSGGSGSSSDTKQTIDWIERKISSLNDNIDLTQSKLDNLFNIKTPKGLSKQITDVSNKLKKASDNTDKWKSKLSKIKIPDSVKKLIQGGKDVNLSKYSKTEQKNIKKYQSTWKSYSSAKKKENSLYNQKWDLQTQKGKEAFLKSQEKDYNTLAKIEEKAYKKYMSKAKSIKLSSSLKKKVQSGDYKISDYSSKTQSLIQEYQDWWDKAQDANKGKYEAKKNAKDKRIERYQLYVDDAESKITKSQAYAENGKANYKNQNSHLEYQKKQIKESYYYQIKMAELEGDMIKADQLRAERKKALNDVTKQEFDNIKETFDYQIDHIDDRIDDLTNKISAVENKGFIADASYYNAQASVHEEILGKLESEKKKLREQLKTIKKQTPAWYDAVESIQSVDNAIADTTNKISEMKKAINGVADTLSGNIIDSFHDLNEEADTLITLLGDNLSDDKLGNLTKEGIAALGLYSQQMNVSKASAENIQNEIQSIQDAINNGTYTKFIDANGMERQFESIYQAKDRIKELQASYRSEIQSTYQYESKIVDLMKQKYQSELNYVKELIDKKKEALNAEKD